MSHAAGPQKQTTPKCAITSRCHAGIQEESKQAMARPPYSKPRPLRQVIADTVDTPSSLRLSSVSLCEARGVIAAIPEQTRNDVLPEVLGAKGERTVVKRAGIG